MQQSRPGSTPAPSEDCLYVNVWTGAKAASERRPVIVWTYGGGFTGGSGSEPRYDGEALARKGAVVVTYNYRLGARSASSRIPNWTRSRTTTHRATTP